MFGKQQKILLVLICVVVVFSVGTAVASSHMGGDGGDAGGEGEIRVVHASPDAPNVDVYVDGNRVLENVSFGDVSRYLSVPAGEHQIEITAAESPDTSVFNESVPVGEGNFTAVALGELAEGSETPFQVEILADNNTATSEGMARVRAVHASPDAPAVDVTVEGTDTVLFDNVSFAQSGYVDVPAGEYTVEIRAAQEDNQGAVVDSFNLTAEAGSVYTAFAVGYLEPSNAPVNEEFDVVTTLDAEPGEDAHGGMEDGMGGNETDGGMEDGMGGNETDGGMTDNETGGGDGADGGDGGGQGMPGFTVVVAIVALIGAALLAARRNN